MKKGIVLLCVVSMFFAACMTIPIVKSSELVTRPVPTAFDVTVAVVQSLGYKITVANKDAGIISAEKVKVQSDWERAWVGKMADETLIVSIAVKDAGGESAMINITVSQQPEVGYDSKVTQKAKDEILSKVREMLK